MRNHAVRGDWEERELPPDAWRSTDSAWDHAAMLELLEALLPGDSGAADMVSRIVPADSLREVGVVCVDQRGALLRPAPTGVQSDVLLWAILRLWEESADRRIFEEGHSLVRVRHEGSAALAYMCLPVPSVDGFKTAILCAFGAEGREAAMCLASRLTVLTSFRSLSPGVSAEPAQKTSDGEPVARGEISPRQMTILEGMAEGMTNRQIAARICFSESTVRLESMAIYRHFGVHSRSQAVAAARASGLLKEHALSIGA